MAQTREIFEAISSEYSEAYRGVVVEWEELRQRKNTLLDLDTSTFQVLFRIATSGLIDYTFSDETFDLMDPIGEGGNFNVFRKEEGIYLKELLFDLEPVVAIKRLKAVVKTQERKPEPEKQAKLRSLLREVHVMSSMKDHPEITSVTGYGHDSITATSIFTSRDYAPFIVMEYAPHGTLRSFLGIHSLLPLDKSATLRTEENSLRGRMQESYIKCDYLTRISFCIDIAAGLSALHSHEIFHTDIKADNVLIFEPVPGVFKAKLSDFGASLIKDPTASENDRFPLSGERDLGGTARYRPPELDQKNLMQLSDQDLCKCDIFSFGAMLYEVVGSFIFPQRARGASAASLDLMLDEVFTIVETLFPQDLADNETVCKPGILRSIVELSIRDLAIRTESVVQILQLFYAKNPGSIVQCEPKSCGVRESQPNSFNIMQLDLNLFTYVNNSYRDLIACHLPIFQLAAYSNDSSILEDMMAASDTGAAISAKEHGKVLFFKGLCFAHGIGVALDYNLACSMILESAQLGYLPARYTYRRIHEALFSINESGEAFQEPQFSPHALKDIDLDLYCALDQLECCDSGGYLAASLQLSERDVWTTRCIEVAQNELHLFTVDEINSKSHQTRRGRLLEFLRGTEIDRMDAASKLRFYDHVLALAIVLDEHGHGFFASVQQRLPIMTFERHLSQIEEQISPLMLACRTTQMDAVRYIASNSGVDFESGDGTIPLHFLFLFHDHDVPNLFVLLSKDLDLSKAYPVSRPVIFIEQLSVFDGNPLAFAIQSGKVSAVKWLATVDSFHRDEDFLRFHRTWIHADISKADLSSLQDPIISQNMVWRLFSLALLRFESYSIFTTDSSYPILDLDLESQDRSRYVLSMTQVSAFQAIRIANQQSCWIACGKSFWRSHFQLWNLIRADMEYATDVGFDFLKHAVSIVALDGPHQVLALAKFAESRLSKERYEDFSQFIHSSILSINVTIPTRSSRLGLVMGRRQDPNTVWLALHRSQACLDSSAFERLLRKSYEYEIDWQDCEVVAQDILFNLAVTSSPASDSFARILGSSKAYRAPKSWTSMVYQSLLTPWYQNDPQPLQASIYFENRDGLLALLKHNLVPMTDPKSHVNVYHLLCSNDAYVDMLSAVLDQINHCQTEELLGEGEGWAGLLPIEIAFYNGCCKCLRTLLEFYKANPQALRQLSCFDSDTLDLYWWVMSAIEQIAELLNSNGPGFQKWSMYTKILLHANACFVQAARFPDSQYVKEKLHDLEKLLDEHGLPPATSLGNILPRQENGRAQTEPAESVWIAGLFTYAARKLHFVVTLHHKPNTWYTVGIISVAFIAFRLRKFTLR